MKVVAAIEARMGSSRCPGKVMATVVGVPLLQLIVERLARSRGIAELVIATTLERGDDAIAGLAEALGVACYRGSSEDVRLRVLEAVRYMGGEIIVQIGADQPFPDPELNDSLVRFFSENEYDYVSNALELTYPLGIVAQVYRTSTLAETEALTRGDRDREGTSDYIWQHPERYRLHNLRAPENLSHPQLRLTVDYPEDLELVRRIYGALYPIDPAFSTADIIELIRLHPDWAQLNGHLVHTNRISWGNSAS